MEKMKTITSPKSLLQHQFLFSSLMSRLLFWIDSETEFYVTFGDFSRTDRQGHKPNSNHYDRLAADLNLFDNSGKFLSRTEDHAAIGAHWKSLHPLCRWGGDFKSKDGNHYSILYQGRQ